MPKCTIAGAIYLWVWLISQEPDKGLQFYIKLYCGPSTFTCAIHTEAI